MTVGDLLDILKGYPLEADVFVGDKIDNTTLAQQIVYDIAHYHGADGEIVEDASLCIISEKR